MDTRLVGYPSRAQFASHVNSRFDVEPGNGAPLSLELVEVEEGRSSPDHEQFALVFRAPRDMPAQQGTYRVKHPVLGALDLFLVPVGREGDDLLLEAVFNRLIASVRD
jgi:hypothetical protein